MLKLHLPSEEAARRLGEWLGRRLQPGDVVCLAGPLGAGKTVVAQGIAAGAGVTDAVVSPTFTIFNVYEGNVPVYHFDLYRLEHSGELEAVGFFAFTAGDGIAIVEWADKFWEWMPPEHLTLQLAVAGETERDVGVDACGERFLALLEEMRLFASAGNRDGDAGIQCCPGDSGEIDCGDYPSD